ncbi:MAG: hypothetical protein ACTSQE_05940 [Candidatus Heimdallarchaeaceae archaeon]
MAYRNWRYGYGPGYGRGMGYARGFGRGWGRGYGVGYRRRWVSPNCDFFPDLPRGWWAMPQYQDRLNELGFAAPPSAARWDPYGAPKTTEPIDYEISLIEQQIDNLQKEIELLEKEKEKLNS